jgi:translation initiation factor IF-2
MDQTKNQGQDPQRQNNPGQGGQQGNKPQGNPGQGGQQNWNQGGGQKEPNRNPNPGQGRDKVRGEEERGLGSQGEQNRESGQRGSSGITNRGVDREMSEQSDLPERGQSRSDRSGSNR